MLPTIPASPAPSRAPLAPRASPPATSTSTPLVAWDGPVEHLFFHTRESLRRLLAAHGLAVRVLRADAAWYTLGYLAERLRKTLLRRAAARPARWPGAGLALPVNLFDVVTVEAVRE